ncbi:MAG TPA: tetratricopeptide repeat protein [Candidatus Cloacimonetes bacterium]|nr:tetratricopeptide repeat protein [Candidatus Cloacimonadota bacterium]
MEKVKDKLSDNFTENLNLFNNLADTYIRFNDFNKALEYYQKALALSQKTNNKEEIANALNNIGITYWNLSDYEKSLESHHESLAIFKAINSKKNIAVTLNNIGNVYQSLSNYDKSLKFHLKSLKIYEDTKDEKGIASSLNNIGILYMKLTDYDHALDFFQRSLDICRNIDFLQGEANALNNIGAIYFDQKNYKKALENFQNSLNSLEKTGDKSSIAATLNNIADVYAGLGDNKQALNHFKRALKFETEINNRFGIALCLKNMGMLLQNDHQYSKASEHFEKSLQIADEINSKELLQEIYLTLSDLNSLQENFQTALENFKKYSKIKDEVFSEESVKKISEMRTIYETERKEKEAEIYRLQNIDLKKEINERIAAEDALRISEERFRSLFEIATEFIIIMDSEYRILQVNPETIRKSGYEGNELIGKKINEIFPTKYNELFSQKYNELKKNNNANLEAEFICKDGTVLIMDCSFSVVYDKPGKTMFVVSFQRDITQKKEIEKMKSDFVSHVSHELRSPLASIKGFTTTILTDKDMEPTTREEFLEIINNESDRLTRLIENLLDISKIESGSVKMKFQHSDIVEILNLAVSNIKPLADKKNIKIEKNFPAFLSIVNCDRDNIYQVIMNLLSNAVKFTPEKGTIKLFIEDKHDQVEVKVSDNGVGIPEISIRKIFDKFYRAGNSQDKIIGTGLGLSIAKEIIKSHHGKIWVESKSGKGSDFYFTLPKKRV